MNTLGIHICSYLDRFTDDPTFAFPMVKKFGIDNIEISILSDYSEKRAVELKNKALDNDLSLTGCTGLPETADLSSKNSTEVANGIDYLKKCIDFCAILGTDKLSGILYSPWGKIDRDLQKRDAWFYSIEPMQTVCEYAKNVGITLCIEALNRFEGNFINTLDEGTEYLKLVNRSNLMLLADTFHANIEEKNPVDSIISNIQNIGNIHITEPNRDFPQSNNPIWISLLTALNSTGYKKGIVFECCVKRDTEIGVAFFQWQDLLLGKNLFEKIEASSYFLNHIL